MRRIALVAGGVLMLLGLAAGPDAAQSPSAASLETIRQQLQQLAQRHRGDVHAYDRLEKSVDDVLWWVKLGDLAEIAKVRIPSRPGRVLGSAGDGHGKPFLIYAYTFTPKNLGKAKAPLIVLVHGGIHSNFDSTTNADIVRELLDQGYIVVAPEYRGSTGYGEEFYRQIDYGGAELDDTFAARNWAVDHVSAVNPQRVGIVGWSHGGYHTLFNVLKWPEAYTVAYAGVPVSDLVLRMSYKGQRYRDAFAEFIGKQVTEDPTEYWRRSPVSHAHKLRTPLLVHTTTNDEDVDVMEVQRLIDTLKAAGKQFEYKIYENAPGGHMFNRINTTLARESRREIYAFLARYLRPGTTPAQ